MKEKLLLISYLDEGLKLKFQKSLSGEERQAFSQIIEEKMMEN